MAPSGRDIADWLVGEGRVDHIDLTLIHWPAPNNEPPVEGYIDLLGEARERGLASLIGLSNFLTKMIGQAESVLGDGAFATNQVEVHPYLQNSRLRTFCEQRDIAVTAYMPLAGGPVITDPCIVKIARKHGADPAQVVISWLLAEGLIAIPATSNPARIRTNLAAPDVRLDDSDGAAIAALECGRRLIDPSWGPAWDD